MRITKCYENDAEKLKDIRQLLYWAKIVNQYSKADIRFTMVDASHYIPKYEKKDKG